MKKVNIGKALDIGHGTCDFCQSKDIDLINGEFINLQIYKYNGFDEIKVIQGEVNLSLLGTKYFIKNWNYRFIDKYILKKADIKPGICENCIKELYKQLLK